MISNEQLQDLVEDDENLDLRDIWRFFSRPGGFSWFPHDLYTFAERRDGSHTHPNRDAWSRFSR